MALPIMKDLLEAGVHFGHPTRKWDPRMKPFIFQERNDIYIIDLMKTLKYVAKAHDAVKELARNGGSFLFVGTKKQATASIRESAKRCNMFYIDNRWPGGMLTNFSTIKKSIARLKRIEKMEVDDTFSKLPKKEVILLMKEKAKLEKNFSGIKEMEGLPDMIFVIDPVQEHIAISEARKLKIPVVSVVDTNCNPEIIDYPIPGNDDAIRAITLFANVIASAIIEGQNEAGKEILAKSDELALAQEVKTATDVVVVTEEVKTATDVVVVTEEVKTATETSTVTEENK